MSLEIVKKRLSALLKKLGEHQHNLPATFINGIQEGCNGVEKIIKTYEDNTNRLKKMIDDRMQDLIPSDPSFPNFAQIYRRIAESALAGQMRPIDNILRRLEDKITELDSLVDKALLDYSGIHASPKSENEVLKMLSGLKQVQDLSVQVSNNSGKEENEVSTMPNGLKQIQDLNETFKKRLTAFLKRVNEHQNEVSPSINIAIQTGCGEIERLIKISEETTGNFKKMLDNSITSALSCVIPSEMLKDMLESTFSEPLQRTYDQLAGVESLFIKVEHLLEQGLLDFRMKQAIEQSQQQHRANQSGDAAPAIVRFMNSSSPTPNHATDSSPASGAPNPR